MFIKQANTSEEITKKKTSNKKYNSITITKQTPF
jgi:hypothetical protein